ncbi:hypothetical protein JSQ80_22685 [Paenibacillus apiarius]|nr:hypothetical protein [Paenibacillus apiarius]
MADAIGETDAAQKYVEHFEHRLAEVRSLLKEKGYAGKTATFVSTTQKGYFVYSDKSVSTYYDDLGFTTNTQVNLDQEVSLEGLSKIDADDFRTRPRPFCIRLHKPP